MLGGDMKIMTRSKAEHKLISGNLVSCEQIVAWCEIYDTSHHNLCLPSRGQPTPTLHGIKSQQRDPDFEHQSSTQQNTATQTSLSLQTQQPKHHFHSSYSLFTTTDSRTQQPKHHFHSSYSLFTTTDSQHHSTYQWKSASAFLWSKWIWSNLNTFSVIYSCILSNVSKSTCIFTTIGRSSVGLWQFWHRMSTLTSEKLVVKLANICAQHLCQISKTSHFYFARNHNEYSKQA